MRKAQFRGNGKWYLNYLASIGFSQQAVEQFWDKRYVSTRMANQIRKTSYIGISRFSGWGMFARKQLPKSTVVGYFSGRALNSVTWSDADPNFISYARWDHPLSEKSHSYYFEVVSPSRYMNGGIHPRYLGNTTNYPMRACVRLHQDALNVNNRFRPVLVLTTMRRIKKHEELLLDYGVLDDGIYYEFLRRGKRYPDSRSERDFSGFLNQAHRMWLSKNGSRSTTDPRDNEIFLNEFAQAYFK